MEIIVYTNNTSVGLDNTTILHCVFAYIQILKFNKTEQNFSFNTPLKTIQMKHELLHTSELKS